MSKIIYKYEFTTHLRSVITWSVSVAVLLLVFISLFASFADQAEILNAAMAKFPPQLITAFGLGGTDLSTVLGYFGYVFLFVQLCLAIQAANYGFSLVSVEEREWTADFLLTRPVKRRQVLTAKLLAALSSLTITNIIVWIGSFTFINMFKGDKTYDTGTLLLLLYSIVVFQLFFLSVGLVISVLAKRVRNVTPYSMGLAFGMYALSVFGGLLGTSFLEKLTPFKHFDPNYIIKQGAWDLPLVLITVAAIIVSLAGSYVLYIRRDIPAVV